jgi:hypothetical protein
MFRTQATFSINPDHWLVFFARKIKKKESGDFYGTKKKKKENSCLVSKWLSHRPLEPHPARASSSLQAVFFLPIKFPY